MKRTSSDVVVADASPMIGLAIIGGLDARMRAHYRLSKELYREILRLAHEKPNNGIG
mgnify:CR=1 FL=1